MLTEILETRIMIKGAMKTHKDNRRLYRILNAKQLGLKLLANVTYGYTSASYSGRMPCSEIADAIVQSGRSTLERSIEYVNTQQNLNVVYADTDSLFIHFAGYTKAEAFNVSYKIVEAVTNCNPRPVTLKFEKVYMPCVLLSKKRYVGFMYESLDNEEPVFDAKGIETVRRDGCKAVQKTLEFTLKILFRTRDLSQVKAYLYEQWSKILSANVNLKDFIIAKEVRIGTYASDSSMPAGAFLAKKNMEKDSNAVPEYAERVPFLVVHKGPKHRLIDASVNPLEVVNDRSLRLHGTYYIEKQIIPAINRVFSLIGVGIAHLT
jgi:DNA polymerase zeta